MINVPKTIFELESRAILKNLFTKYRVSISLIVN